MGMGMNSPGISKLASMIRDISKTANPDIRELDYGKINSDKSLRTNEFAIDIPADDYHSCVDHLRTGDQVLVAWVGDDPCIVGIVRQAEDCIDDPPIFDREDDG